MTAERPLVLLLDDDELWLRSLARLMRARGARCVCVTRPEEAMAAPNGDDSPELVVVDYELVGTGWTGGEVARELRKRGEMAPALALVSGALARIPEEERTLFDTCYPKTIGPDVLADELCALVRQRRHRPRSEMRIKRPHLLDAPSEDAEEA